MAAVCIKMLLFCAVACWWWGPVSTGGGDTSNLNWLVRRSAAAGSVVGATTLDRVGEMEKTNLTCFSTTDPQSVKVNHIYDGFGEDAGFLWRGQPADMSPCYNTSTPAPSRCVPCLPDRNQAYLVVCKDIPTIRLVMEADGENLDINITAGDCPSFTKPADPALLGPTLDAALKEHQQGKETEPVQCQKPCEHGGVCAGLNRCRCASGYTGSLCETELSTAGQLSWWGGLIITAGIIVAVLSFLAYWKRKSIGEFITPKTPAGGEDRHTNGHALSEVSPMMTGDSVDKPDGT